MSDEPDYFELGNPLLGMIQSSGGKVSEPALIEFAIFCPNLSQTQKLAEELSKQGYKVDEKASNLEQRGDDKSYFLQCTKVCRPDEADSEGAIIREIAKNFECTYDGWGTSV